MPSDNTETNSAAEKRATKLTDTELLARIRKRFALMEEGDRTNRTDGLADMEFLHVPGAQWEPGVKKARGDRPCYEFNKTRIKAKRIANTKPSRELTAFVAMYTHPAYGEAKVAASEAGLSIQWSSFHVPLEHWHHDTFRNVAPNEYVLEGEFLVFNFEADGAIRGFRWLGQDFIRQKATKKAA